MKDQLDETSRLDNLEPVFGRTTFDGATAFRVMQAAFQRAREKNPDSFRESFYTCAGQSVRICVIGRTLAHNITQPFSHLQTARPTSPTPQLTIELWDENETGIRLSVPNDNSDWTEITVTSSDHRFVGQRRVHSFACLDRITNRIIGSIAWNERISVYERAKPFARLLLEWCNDYGVQVIHAGLVAHKGQGILFVGKSGSGKSTSSLACLCAGFNYLGEDYVGLQRLPDGSFLGHSLYSSIFLETGHLARFPSLLSYSMKGRPEEEKSAVLLAQAFPEKLMCVVPIRVLLIPRIVHAQEPKIYPASRAQALLTLGPSSLFQIHSQRTYSFDNLTQLVEQVPCYWLELGRDLSLIPRCVEELMTKGTLS